MLNKLLTAFLLLTATSLLAEDWPNFLGPNRNGISNETGLDKDWNAKPPRELWRVPMSDDGYAGPAVANGNVFIINHEGDKDIVRALDLKTGKEIWTFAYTDNAKANYGFARATPCIDNGTVYTVSRFGVVHCLDQKTGQTIWSQDMVKEFKGKLPQWQMAVSPLVDGDRLIVCPGGASAAVVALNKKTGAVVWKGGGSDIPGYATPVVATLNGRKQYLVFTAKNLIGVDAANGNVLWQVGWETKYDINAATPLVVGSNQVFITSNYGHGCAMINVTTNSASIAWENKELSNLFNSPILYRNHIYGISGPLACLDPQTGKVLWRGGSFESGGLVIVDGVIIAVDGYQGEVIMAEANPQAYRRLGHIKPLGGQSWTAPIVADGKLIIRNKSALACLELKPPR